MQARPRPLTARPSDPEPAMVTGTELGARVVDVGEPLLGVVVGVVGVAAGGRDLSISGVPSVGVEFTVSEVSEGPGSGSEMEDEGLLPPLPFPFPAPPPPGAGCPPHWALPMASKLHAWPTAEEMK